MDTTNLTNIPNFQKFAEVFDGNFELPQFERINDTTISWKTGKYGTHNSNVVSPNVFITLAFDDRNCAYFILEVKFVKDKSYYQNFPELTKALDHLNAAVRSVRYKKERVNSIWERYGF